jgi:signal transduction histidine kinase
MSGRIHAQPSLEDQPALAAALFSSLDLGKTGLACAKLAARMLHAPEVGLYVISGSTVELVASVVDGMGSERERARVPEAVAHRMLGVAALGEVARQEEDGTTLIPLCHQDLRIGVLAVATPSDHNGSSGWRDKVGAVAAWAAIALGNALAFRDAEERAERLADLERTKTQFLNLASHELRGPLTVLMGYLSLLEDGAFGEVPAELAATLPAINSRISEMDALITAMLETARLEDDRLELTFSAEDLCEIAVEAIGRAEAFIEHGQQVTFERPAGRLPVTVDRARITLAVGNLLSNALKYSVDHTDVHCEVRLENEEAVVAVTDRGIGIAEEDLPILFTRFGRVRRHPAVRAIPGTGLGLFLARELVRAHGGEITVESTAGEGSTFMVRLRAAH